MVGMRLDLGQYLEGVWEQLWGLIGDSVCRCDDALGRGWLTGSRPAGGVASLIGVVALAVWQGRSFEGVSCNAIISINTFDGAIKVTSRSAAAYAS